MLAHINSFDFPFAFLMDSFPSPTSRNETSCATKFFTWFRWHSRSYFYIPYINIVKSII